MKTLLTRVVIATVFASILLLSSYHGLKFFQPDDGDELVMDKNFVSEGFDSTPGCCHRRSSSPG